MGSLTAGTIMEILWEGLVVAQRGRARTLGRRWIWFRVWVPAVFAVLSLGPRSCLGICFLTAQSVPRVCPQTALPPEASRCYCLSGWFLCSSSSWS